MASTALPHHFPGAAEPAVLALRVRLRRGALDRALADGAPSDGHLDLALRARQLATPAEARLVAGRLAEILGELDRPPARALTARVPIQRAQVVAARPFLATLADRLVEAPHPGARGVARARLLVTDGTSPLYAPADPGALARLAWRATDAL